MMLVWVALGSLLAAGWTVYTTEARMTPDGEFYMLAARGVAPPQRYCWRWALPTALGPHPLAWQITSGLALAACPVLLAALLLARGLEGNRAAFGAALLVGLPLWHFGFMCPVLTDQSSLALGLSSALAAGTGHPFVAAGLALAGGAVHETTPVWAAIYAWSWVPLLGLLAVVPAVLFLRPGPTSGLTGERRAWVIAHPWLASHAARAGRGWDFWSLVAPWGAVAVLAPLATPTAQLLTALAVGYGQLLCATDCVRFYQRAAPVAIAAAATVAPDSWLPAIAVAHLFNPWRGDGV